MALLKFPLCMNDGTGREDYSTSYTQDWDVTEAVALSGARKTCVHQLFPKITFKLKYNGLTRQEARTLMGFYNQCMGSAIPFLYLDSSLSGQHYVTLPGAVDGKVYLRINVGNSYLPCPLATDVTYQTVSGTYVSVTPSTDDYNSWLPASTAGLVAEYHAWFKVYFKSLSIKDSGTNYYSADVTLITCY